MDGCIDTRIAGWLAGQMAGWMDRLIDDCIYIGMDRSILTWVSGWTGGWWTD